MILYINNLNFDIIKKYLRPLQKKIFYELRYSHLTRSTLWII